MSLNECELPHVGRVGALQHAVKLIALSALAIEEWRGMDIWACRAKDATVQTKMGGALIHA